MKQRIDPRPIDIRLIAVFRCLVLVLCALISACATTEEVGSVNLPQPTSQQPTNTPVVVSEVSTYTDLIPYAGKFHIHQYLSVRLPEDAAKPYPTVIMFHAGGFSSGDKSDMDVVEQDLSERGIAVLNVNYRLSGYPAPVEDAFCTFAWVHQQAISYGFDTDRVVSLGLEAGGTLALLLGMITEASPYLTDCPNGTLLDHAIAGVVSYSPINDYGAVDDFKQSLVFEHNNSYLHKTQDGYEQRVRDASPMSHIHSDAPPILLFQGLDDHFYKVEHTEHFVTALRYEGVPVEFITVPEVDLFIIGAPSIVPDVTVDDLQLDKVETFIRNLE
jgi:acetyl esterase/lipase